jgi:hypothetical protein
LDERIQILGLESRGCRDCQNRPLEFCDRTGRINQLAVINVQRSTIARAGLSQVLSQPFPDARRIAR